jgi:hypothetical protein
VGLPINGSAGEVVKSILPILLILFLSSVFVGPS